MGIRIWRIVLVLICAASQAMAQGLVPDHRYLPTLDVDFYGSDLTPLFDTSQSACARACTGQEACVAYTFNTRSNACFPKSAVSELRGYEGAVSARKVATTPQILTRAAEGAEQLGFLRNADKGLARDLIAQNAARYSFAQNERIEDIIAALGAAEASGSLRNALFWAGKGAALTDRADLWARYARLALQRVDQVESGQRNRLRREALSAAINGYLRSESGPQRATLLDIMAEGLLASRRGGDVIPALRLALREHARDDLAAKLDDAIGKYGFRLVDHRVDNDAAQPRICAEFSEELIKAGTDYRPFVRLEGRGFAVEANDASLCIDGVEHGKRYEVTMRRGLPSASGETLHKDVTLRLYVRDRTPSVRFPGRAYVLPRSADAALPVETVNVDELALKLRRVSDRNLIRAIRESYFGRPLAHYEEAEFAADLAQEVWTGKGRVQNDLNTDMTTRLPLAAALAGQGAGIYVLSASVPGQDPYDFPAASQWFVLSDLGLSTWSGVDGMHVAVRRLSDAEAQPDVTLTLISRANAVLGQIETDDQGSARFPAGLTRGSGAAAPALLMAAQGDDDIAFLSLTDSAFDLSDRGVAGHAPAPPLDVFLATDRGAYRAGETIFATALLRDEQARALTNVPLTAVLRRPDGVEFQRKVSSSGMAGGHVFDFATGSAAPRGAWRLDVYADPKDVALASSVVLVEDFLPERLDFDIALPAAPLMLDQPATADVQVDYLFGAPGADLPIEGDVRLVGVTEIADWPGYQFGRYDARFSARSRPVDPLRTNATGRASLSFLLPQVGEETDQPLSATITLRVADGGGRPVERQATQTVARQKPIIGIKPGFDGILPELSQATFDLIGVNPAGSPAAMPVRWTVNRVQTRYQWYQLYGNWNWEPVTRRIRVASGEAMLGDAPMTVSAPTEWGRYEIVVEQTQPPFAASSYAFTSGWYGGDGQNDTPDRLELSLDAERYAIGDQAQLRIVPRTDGVALVSVLSKHVVDQRVVAVTAGENLIPLAVTKDWGSGAYVTVSVIHAMDADQGLNPARSLGLAHAAVAPGDRQLAVSLSAPEITDGQEGAFSATVEVAGVSQGDTAYVTLAAVDVGILNLTGYDAPDPSDHFFGQRRLGVELRDLYGRLIDGMNGAMGQVRSGGDAAAQMAIQSPPPTEKLMAYFSGPVKVGPNGKAEVQIVKPAFNGTIRLMAVAWSQRGVGQSVMDVTARDPVVVSAALPRFLAPGDQSRLQLEFVHTSGATGQAALHVEAADDLQLSDVPTSVALTQAGTTRLSVPLSAARDGDHALTVSLQTPQGDVLRKDLIVPVRTNDPERAVTRRFSLAPGQTFTFDQNVLAGLKPNTASATLSAGPLARFDVPGLLRQLDRYPYGCTEQVTSAALPLLYLDSLADASGLAGPDPLEKRINGAVQRVLARQGSNGAFGLWRAGSGEFWLDAYVTDFLARARTQGHTVPDRAFRLAMDNLRNRVSYYPDFDRGGEDLAFALLVLAREGAAAMGDLRYYADTKADAFATPLSQAQLGAALAAYGDQLRADQMFQRAARSLAQDRRDRQWRADFGSHLRDAAGVLRLAAEAGSAALNTAGVLPSLQTERRLSTQEAAQVILAAHALSADAAAPSLLVDGAPAAGTVVRHLTTSDTTPAVIENIGQSAMDITVTAFGVPQVPEPADGYGYGIKRSYFTLDGAPVAGPVKTGTRLVTVLEIQSFEDVPARLIVDDPLPAGLEIDNPNLLRSGDIAAFDWLETAQVETVQFRSDRFVAAVDHGSAGAFRLAYVVRAVTPGDYHHPAALVEDMYRPEYRAVTDTGRLTVTE